MNGLMEPVSNFSGAPVVTGRAVINIDELKIDLGTLGGANSWMNWGAINDHGEAVGFAETAALDPDGEDFCTFGTGRTCRPFLWQKGHMSALPTLGGNNGSASGINNRGQIVGTAQTTVSDSGCPAKQIQLPVLWEKGKARPLPTVDKDPDGIAYAINEQGQVVGDTQNCSGTIIHAVWWRGDAAFALPDLGTGALAQDINDRGQIAGTIGSADNTTEYAAIWQNGALANLRTLPGDFAAIATGINNRGQVVGSTLDSGFSWLRGFIWQDGVMTDLNKLIPESSNLYITMANRINERGQISGMATVRSGPHMGDIHAFLATPTDEGIDRSVADVAPAQPSSNLPAGVNKQLMRRFVLPRLAQ